MDLEFKIVKLKCASCGAALEIQRDMEQFACGFCGSEQIVERRGGTVMLRLVADAVARVQVGTDRTAAELAIVRLEKELAATNAEWQVAFADFNRGNQSGSPLSVAFMTLAIIFVVCGLYGLVDNTATIETRVLGGAFVALSIPVFLAAKKRNTEAAKRFTEGRASLWRPFDEKLQNLSRQIEKNRRIVGEPGD